jgi:hypothetical protein
MDSKDLHKFIEGILHKKRNCIPLSKEEQTWADETYGRLFEKKFGGRTFIVKTKDDIRKAAGKPKNVQPDAPIADERSESAKKEKKIDDSDESQNEGAVVGTEDGENVNVDEKRVGGEDSAETEATTVNASDIINSDKDDLQRKPVLKSGDVVIKRVGQGKLLAGIILKVYEKEQAAMVKWAGGTFSTDYLVRLEKVAEEEESHEVPVSADETEGTEIPGQEVDTELEVNKAFPPKKEEKPEDQTEETPTEEVAETPEHEATEPPAEENKEATEEVKAEADPVTNTRTEEIAPPNDKPGEKKVRLEGYFTGKVIQAWEAPTQVEKPTVPEASEVPETPEKPAVSSDQVEDPNKIEEKKKNPFVAKSADATEEVAEADDKDEDDDWMESCAKAVGINKNAEDPKTICSFIRSAMGKSTDKVVKMDIEEIRKSNPKLADQMEAGNFGTLHFDVEKFEKGGPGSGRKSEGRIEPMRSATGGIPLLYPKGHESGLGGQPVPKEDLAHFLHDEKVKEGWKKE